MDDRDVLIIEQYIRDDLPKSTDYFDLYVFSQWAAYEVLERVISEAMKLPPHITGKEPRTLIEVVEDFIDEMDCYYWMSSFDKARNMFSIARDEGMCILLYISSFERKEN